MSNFGPHSAIFRECSCAKHSQGYTAVFIIPNCGEIINMMYIFASLRHTFLYTCTFQAAVLLLANSASKATTKNPASSMKVHP